MLSGHWPYWDPEKITYHPDELLRARLSYADHTKSLVEQELITLADGLEGRKNEKKSERIFLFQSLIELFGL